MNHTFDSVLHLLTLWVIGILVYILVCTPLSSALAATDNFTISQGVIAADTSPPTIPMNLVVTPVGLSELDLTWDASTDNVGVTGYQVFRDGIQIATSTLTNYADTGLGTGVSYDYTITAFDGAGNISTSSATTTGTTNSVIVPPPAGGNAAKPVVPIMRDFKIEVTEYTAHLSWKTSIPTRSVVSWGLTGDYEIASLSENIHLSNHGTLLTGLLPGTHYQFKILARDKAGNETVLREDSFVTVALPDTVAPPNVHGLTGRVEGDDAVLSWQNPEVSDFAKVRIVRKDSGYPRDPYDGTLIYEGDGEEYRDRGAFAQDGILHYAVFAYDQKGNDSSGAVVRLEKRAGVVSTAPKKEPVEVDMGESGALAPLRFEDLIFEQQGRVVSYVGEGVPLDATQPFTIKIPYGRLPEHLKTILVTFADPSDAALTFSFLLRVNKEKTAYTATIDSLGVAGEYPLSLSVLDYKEQTLSKVAGRLEVKMPQKHVTQKETGFLGFILAKLSIRTLMFMIASLLLLLFAIYITTKKKSF